MCPSLAEPDSGGFPIRTSLRGNGLQRSAKGGSTLLLPASVLQLPRCLTRTYNLNFHDSTLFELDSFKNAIAAGKTCCKHNLLSQMWAARPHLGSIFEKLLHRKTFQLPAARISAAISKNLTVLVFFHKNFSNHLKWNFMNSLLTFLPFHGIILIRTL